MQLTKKQLIDFHQKMEKKLGIKYIGDPGFIQRLWQRLLERIFRKFALLVPDSVYKLRPRCFKNLIYLPYMPGTSELSWMEQVLNAVKNATHALQIRRYPGRVSQWYGEYFTNDRFRALQESSAIMASNEVYYYLTGKIKPLNLDGYLILSEETIRLVTTDYNRQTKQIERFGRGTAFHEAATVAIDELCVLLRIGF